MIEAVEEYTIEKTASNCLVFKVFSLFKMTIRVHPGTINSFFVCLFVCFFLGRTSSFISFHTSHHSTNNKALVVQITIHFQINT